MNRARPDASAVAWPITVDPSTNETAPVPGDTRAVRVTGWSATVLGFEEVSTSAAAAGAAYRTVAVSPPVLASQNWVRVASSDVMRPAGSALIAWTVNLPLTSLHPRPVLLTSSPPYVVLNPARVTFS